MLGTISDFGPYSNLSLRPIPVPRKLLFVVRTYTDARCCYHFILLEVPDASAPLIIVMLPTCARTRLRNKANVYINAK